MSAVSLISRKLDFQYETSSITDTSDLLLFLALVLLPIDGTVLGIPFPYWTPISPWFFLAFTVANWRSLQLVARRYLVLLLFPLFLVLISIFGWQTIGFHGWAATKSLLSVVLGLACFTSLVIALQIKRLPWRPMVTVLVTTYWFAFAVGVVQYLGIRFQQRGILEFFQRMMYRPYTLQRPQFLFAEPSYIGMHLFGVLLPLYWMTRDKRLSALTVIFAAGAIAMGAGTRIIIDSVAAGVLWIIATIRFNNKKATLSAIVGLSAISVGGIVAIVIDPRLNALATKGLLSGDSSMSARVFHIIVPVWSWKHNIWHLLLGWGAGNTSSAVRAGYRASRSWYNSQGGINSSEINGLANPPADAFTMSAYTSFITEYGLISLSVLLIMIIFAALFIQAWSPVTVCWIVLLGYLYMQFEAYSFYAIPFFLVVIYWKRQRITESCSF